MKVAKQDSLPTENVIQKIQKLLALTQNPNEHEATLAAEKAMELITKYNLDMAQIAVETGTASEGITHENFPMGERSSIAWSWMITLGLAVGRACYCKTLFYESARLLTYIGRPTNIAAGRVLYNFLQQQMLTMAEAASRTPGQYMHRSKFKSGWLIGAAEKVGNRLDEKRLQEEAANCSTITLVVCTRAENQAYSDLEFKVVETKYKYEPAKRALVQGYRDGDKIKLEMEQELLPAKPELIRQMVTVPGGSEYERGVMHQVLKQIQPADPMCSDGVKIEGHDEILDALHAAMIVLRGAGNTCFRGPRFQKFVAEVFPDLGA